MNTGALLVNLLIIALPILVLVLIIRGQRRRQRAMEEFQSGLTLGDEVVTTSGLMGRVTDLDDSVVALEAAPGVILRFDRRAIAMRTTPTGDMTAETGDDAGNE